jgi:hypothetical protein
MNHQPILKSAVRTRYNAATYRIGASDGNGNRVIYNRNQDAPIETDHYNAALKLVAKRCAHSGISPDKFHIYGGWLKAGEYVWVLVEKEVT